ncbi:MAG TPA: ribosome small subunit-dependent GTPase A [Mycobacteriales bacterium]|nr:ribosome small subunit-dependent GTPase A [Mycobacteriales bacterium]
MSPRELDEDDVRVRARGGSRRRTRDRPAHSDARTGMVISVDRGRYTCWVDDGELIAMRGADVRRTPLVVGDRVAVVGGDGTSDGLGRIVRLEPRASVLRRSPDDDDPIERPVVANADLLVCVVALADPPPRTGLIDRVLVAAYDGGLTPALCLTKSDLVGTDDHVSAAAELRATYAPLGLSVVHGGRTDDLHEVEELLSGRTSVLFGHSGVGKSTLVNRLVPDADRETGDVNAVTGRGRHTSSGAVAFRLGEGDAWVIDTAGIRSFGLGHLSPNRVLAAFSDLAPGAEECPTHCTHSADAPECALDQWVADGHAEPARLASLRRLLAARDDDA